MRFVRLLFYVCYNFSVQSFAVSMLENHFFFFQLLYQKDIKDLNELVQVTKLILDGNPLCADFRSPEEYIKLVIFIIVSNHLMTVLY